MKKQKNAVVVIHGMGEQLPMDTLRGFVATVALQADPQDQAEVLFNKPDRFSDGTDLRRINLVGSRHRHRPSTDFFEYYWTPEFAPGRFIGLIRWAAKYLTKPFWTYDLGNTRHLVAWLQSVFCVGILAVLTAWILVGQHWPQVLAWLGTFPGKVAVAAAVLLLGTVAYLGWRFTRLSLSDVLRYFAPSPRDTRARDNIRRRGVELVKRLHADESYDRIIVVGHSLGSVIAYDILRLAWDELRHVPDSRKVSGGPLEAANYQQVLQSFDADAQALLDSSKTDKFMRLQLSLSEENQHLGIVWRVTDFVTLGSPLSHGVTLFGNKKTSLDDKFQEREFPTCPPTTDSQTGNSFFRHKHPEDSSENYWVADSAATFGPTQWTNIYFPTNRFLVGDPVGGPLAPIFGSGVKDVPVRLSYAGFQGVIRKVVPFWSHTLYWSRQGGTFDGLASERKERDVATHTKDAVPALKTALRL